MAIRHSGWEGFIYLSLSWGEGKARPQGRNLEAGTEAKTMEGCCLLASCLACFLIGGTFSCLELASPTVGWALPHQSRKRPHTCLHFNLMDTFSHLRFPLPRWPSLACVKLTKTNHMVVKGLLDLWRYILLQNIPCLIELLELWWIMTYLLGVGS